jgi:hypothetical protein
MRQPLSGAEERVLSLRGVGEKPEEEVEPAFSKPRPFGSMALTTAEWEE